MKISSRHPFLGVVVLRSTPHYYVGFEKFKNNYLSLEKEGVWVFFVPFFSFYKFETRITFAQIKLEGWNLVYRFGKVPRCVVGGSVIQTIIYLYQWRNYCRLLETGRGTNFLKFLPRNQKYITWAKRRRKFYEYLAHFWAQTAELHKSFAKT